MVNHRSINLCHDELVGVKWKVKRPSTALSPNAIQMQPTDDGDRTHCSIFTTTRATASSPIWRGAPGTGLVHQRETLLDEPPPPLPRWRDGPTTRATSEFPVPRRTPSRTRNRWASGWGDLGRWAHRCSVSRSSPSSTTCVFRRQRVSPPRDCTTSRPTTRAVSDAGHEARCRDGRWTGTSGAGKRGEPSRFLSGSRRRRPLGRRVWWHWGPRSGRIGFAR